MDTALGTYRRGDGSTVTLVAAVHVADAAYYQSLQKRFESFDAVLYEMVKPTDLPVTAELTSDSPISMLQGGMKRLLDLEFQLEAIDYTRPNFVHADMDPDTFFEQQNRQGESILGLMLRGILEEQNRKSAEEKGLGEGLALLMALMSDDSAHALKFMFAKQLSDVESLLEGIDQGPDGEGSVLVSGRNQVVMRVLGEQLARHPRRLAIFYGAGHMSDMEKRLLAIGFRPVRKKWITAWDIRKSAKPASQTPSASSAGSSKQ